MTIKNITELLPNCFNPNLSFSVRATSIGSIYSEIVRALFKGYRVFSDDGRTPSRFEIVGINGVYNIVEYNILLEEQGNIVAVGLNEDTVVDELAVGLAVYFELSNNAEYFLVSPEEIANFETAISLAY